MRDLILHTAVIVGAALVAGLLLAANAMIVLIVTGPGPKPDYPLWYLFLLLVGAADWVLVEPLWDRFQKTRHPPASRN